MWLDNLRAMKEKSGLTTKEISTGSNIPEPTLEKLFSGATKDPKLTTMGQLVRFLGFTLDDLEGLSGEEKSTSALSGEALQVAKDYSGLDRHGRSMTRLVISEEQRRMLEEKAAEEAQANLTPFPIPRAKTSHNGIVTIEVFEEPSAAGPGNYVSDAPASHMEQYPEGDIHSKTDYGVIISGQSMEPKYPDKAVVFVRSTQVVEPEEIGIFLLDGQTYVKQLQVDPDTGSAVLHSLNPNCQDIEVSPYVDFRVLGKVLGGYDPATGKVIWK